MWLTLFSIVHAQEVVNPFREVDESEFFRLDERLVTVASRYAQTVRKAPSIVSVIDADEIRENGYRTVSEALRTLPGLYLWTSSEGRDLAAIRGVISPDNNKLLVLLDGVPYYDGLYTHGAIDDSLPISAIKQIELIKGPGSAIYGTNAFAGVVNLVTWNGRDLEGASVRLMASTGSRYDLTATAGGRQSIAGVELNASAQARIFGQEGFGLDATPDGQRNAMGYDPRRGISAGAQVSLGGLELRAMHFDSQHRFREQAEFNDPTDATAINLENYGLAYSNTILQARLAINEIEGLTLTPFMMGQWHDNPGAFTFGDTVVETEKRTTRWTAGLDLEARPGIDHRLVAGFGLENTVANSVVDAAFFDGADFPVLFNNFTVYDNCGTPAGFEDLQLQLTDGYPDRACQPPALRNLYGYAQYTWTVSPNLELTAGARFDQRFAPVNTSPPPDILNGADPNSAVFSSISPRAGILWVPSEVLTAKLLYGRAFRAPTVRELLVVSAQDDEGQYESTTGNFLLRPEVIHTVEAEVVAEISNRFSARVDGNYSQLNSEIDKVDPGLYCNLPWALRVIGAEADVSGNFGVFEGKLGYSMSIANYLGNADDACIGPDGAPVDNGDANNAYAGRRQYEFPVHMAKGSVGVRVAEKFRVATLGELYGPRPRTEWGPIEPLDIPPSDGRAFVLLHAVASARDLGPKQNIGLNLAVRNVLDSQAATAQYRDDAREVGVNGRGQSQIAYQEGYRVSPRSVTVGVEFEL